MSCYHNACCLLVAFCCLFCPLNAQVNNFQPGYYIDLQGDTIPAKISQDGDLFLSKFIKVRKDEGGNTVEMRPVEVSGFGFPEQNLHYQRISHKYETEDGEKIEVPRFARRLVAGYYDLYRLEQFAGEFVKELSDVPSHTYYLQNLQRNLFKLEQVEERVTRKKYRIIDRYKGGLKYLMQDWSLANREIDKIRYKDAEIAGVISRYNQYKNPELGKENLSQTQFKENFFRTRVSTSIATLGNQHSHKSGFGASLSYYLYNPRFSNSIVIGVGAGFFSNDYGPRFAGNLEIGSESLTAITVPMTVDFYLSRIGKFSPKVKLLLTSSVTKAERFLVSDQRPGRIRRPVMEWRRIKSFALYYGMGVGVEVTNFEINLQAERSQFLAFKNNNLDFNTVIFVSLGIEYNIGRKRTVRN